MVILLGNYIGNQTESIWEHKNGFVYYFSQEQREVKWDQNNLVLLCNT